MNVLVIGGAGYIGSHCCKALSQAGYTPIVYDNLSKGHAHAVKWGPLEVGDTADGERLHDVVRRYDVRGAIYLASFIEVSESVVDSLSYYHNNVANTVSVLQQLQSIGAFVFSSTAAVYGEPKTIPIKEDTELHPINPYGWSKFMSERIIQDQFASGGVPYAILRYFNAAGADPYGEIGEEHEPESHLIPRACLSVLNGKCSFPVYGSDYPTRDGTAIRDYIHVTDLANAHVLALSHLLDGGQPDIFNLGSGQGLTVLEVLQALREASGEVLDLRFEDRRPGDPAVLLADARKAKRVLGWRPAITEPEDIVGTAFAFLKSRALRDAPVYLRQLSA